jgi:hypothetical protein
LGKYTYGIENLSNREGNQHLLKVTADYVFYWLKSAMNGIVIRRYPAETAMNIE